MINKQDLYKRRLTIAIQEAKDADRVWLLATAQHEREVGDDDDLDARRRLDALWQERERANHRVAELRWVAGTRQRRPVPVAQRIRSARRTAALIGHRVTRGSL